MMRPVRRRAMTLVEMTITVLGVSILLFLLMGWMSGQREASKRDLAIRVLSDLDKSLLRYRRATGAYPPAEGPDPAAMAVSHLLLLGRTRDIIDDFPVHLRQGSRRDRLIDPWGTPLRYLSDKSGKEEVQVNSGRPVFISAGPDRDFGDSDVSRIGDNLRSDDPNPQTFRLHDTLREAFVEEESVGEEEVD